MAKRPAVSIICCTYNNEPYIQDALNSFLAQKTNFPIEILIHDDASTDNTSAIIKEYAKAYPQIIKPIFQMDNQLNKGIDVQHILYERARGKYIAICDGNSFWVDEYKLQRQYDYLEKTKNCVLSVHAGKVVGLDGKQIDDIGSPSKMSRFYDTGELIKGDSGFVTNSMFFRANIVKNRPSLFMNTPVPNYMLLLYLSLFGQVQYMRDEMSCCRGRALESVTTKLASGETNKHNFQEIGEWFLRFDEWTNYCFHDAIEGKLRTNDFIFETKDKEFKQLDPMSLSQVYTTIPVTRKVVVLLERYLPQIVGLIKRKQWRMYQLLYRRDY